MKRLELTVHGRVQGVNFRYEAVRKATRLGLVGIVGNQPDGSVYFVAEGPESKLKMFQDWASAGPPAAQVTRRQVSWKKPTQQFEEFSAAP